MSHHRRQGRSGTAGRTFAQIVAGAKGEPMPRTRKDSFWGFDRVVEQLSPEHAASLVRAGAFVAYDRCGCGGECGYEWLSPGELAQLGEAGHPIVQPVGPRDPVLELWQSHDGKNVIVTNSGCTWGDVL